MSVTRARALRKAMTPQEVKLWAQLRKLRLQGFHFRRQAPLEGYILDFVCFKYRLIIEIDGGHHGDAQQLAHDARRDAVFATRGFPTLRMWNTDIDSDLDAAVETILARAAQNVAAPHSGGLHV